MRIRRLSAGEWILREGEACAAAPFVVEGSIRVYKLAELVRELLARSPVFRDFVLAQYAERMVSIIELVREVAFRRVDERLGSALAELGAAATDGRIPTTHRELAERLGTSREVVRRILKDWEERGLLDLGRGEIRFQTGFAAPRA